MKFRGECTLWNRVSVALSYVNDVEGVCRWYRDLCD